MATNTQDGRIVLTTYFFYIIGNNIRGITLSLAFVYNKDTRVLFRSMKAIRMIRQLLKLNSDPVAPYINDPSSQARNKQPKFADNLTESLI